METSNRIKNEIEHGKYIAEKGEAIWNWSSPAGGFRWKRRVDMFRDGIGNGNKKILEVGCGTGLFTEEIAKTDNKFIAIDISENLLKIAKGRIKTDNVEFKIENACKTTFDNNVFDHIIGSSILHHLEIGEAINEFYRILKPGGSIIFTEPNMLNPQIMLQKNIPWLKKKLGDSPDETAFVKWNLKKQLELAGYINIEIIPFDFLHPGTPAAVLPVIGPILFALEKIPLLKEIAGSLFIQANK